MQVYVKLQSLFLTLYLFLRRSDQAETVRLISRVELKCNFEDDTVSKFAFIHRCFMPEKERRSTIIDTHLPRC